MNKKHILCTFVVLILIITNSSYAFPKPMGRRAGLVSKSTSFYIPPEERTRNLTQSFTNDDNNAFSAIGRLSFKSASGQTGYCTATVIQTDNGNIALTAAHCLWDILTNNWYSEVSFYPGYDNGNQGNLGMVWAHTLTVWNNFAQDSEVSDYGFIKFYYEDGRKLQDDAGAFIYDGFVAGGEYPTTVFGYPDGGQMDCPRDGEHLCRWQGNSNVPSSGLPNYNWYREIPIDVGKGASGGPWIRNYDANTNTGNIMGVSHGMLLPPYPQSGTTTSWAWENEDFSELLQDAENYNP